MGPYEVQQTRWDRILRRVSGSIGPGSRVAETLSELFPVLDVENVPGELLRLGGYFPCFGGGTVVGGAGSSARIQLFNPAASGQLITCSHFGVSTTSADTIRYGVNATALATPIDTQIHRDVRTPITTRPVGTIRTDITVALAPATGQFRVATDGFVRTEDPNAVAILPPGTGLQVGASTDATRIFVTFFWRERPAEEAELAF